MHQREQSPTSVLGDLRGLVSARGRITFTESLRIAERQANRLLELHQIRSGAVPTSPITDLPKITVEYTGRLVYGASFWDTRRKTWVIQLPQSEPPEHNRFTLAHEFKHIVDHGRQSRLYRGTIRTDPSAQAEQAADYFAGCFLVPRKLLKSLWENGIDTTGELAEIFQVSEYTIGARLQQTRIVQQQQLRHLPSPIPYIEDDEVDPQSNSDQSPRAEEGAVAA